MYFLAKNTSYLDYNTNRLQLIDRLAFTVISETLKKHLYK
jgi:hypothetical protein